MHRVMWQTVKLWLQKQNITEQFLTGLQIRLHDLNPFENVWRVMKNHLSKLQPVNIADFKAKLLKFWAEITPDI